MNTVLKFLVPVCCITLASAWEFDIPGLGKIDVPLGGVEALSCLKYATNFASQYTTPSAACGGSAYDTTQWNNYKLGFSAVQVGNPAVARNFGTSLTTCKAVVVPDELPAIQATYCDYINAVVTACACDKTTCIAGDVLETVKTDNANLCYAVPTSICESAQTKMEPVCTTAVSAPVTGIPGVTYDKTKVHLHCAPADCPRSSASSGALKLTAMVALVTMITSVIVS